MSLRFAIKKVTVMVKNDFEAASPSARRVERIGEYPIPSVAKPGIDNY